MFDVRDTVANHGRSRVTLYPYALCRARRRAAEPAIHGVCTKALSASPTARCKTRNISADDIQSDSDTKVRRRRFQSTGGWLGITDKYWMAAVIPPQIGKARCGIPGHAVGLRPKPIRRIIASSAENIAPGATHNRRPAPLRRRQGRSDFSQNYEDKQGVAEVSTTPIDWGWFWFFTQPIFYAARFPVAYIGNFGLAILLLTVLIKLAVLPARQCVLSLDEQDEEAAAGDGAHQDEASQTIRRSSSRRSWSCTSARRSIRCPAACRC